jgi:hypothetical protein
VVEKVKSHFAAPVARGVQLITIPPWVRDIDNADATLVMASVDHNTG